MEMNFDSWEINLQPYPLCDWNLKLYLVLATKVGVFSPSVQQKCPTSLFMSDSSEPSHCWNIWDRCDALQSFSRLSTGFVLKIHYSGLRNTRIYDGVDINVSDLDALKKCNILAIALRISVTCFSAIFGGIQQLQLPIVQIRSAPILDVDKTSFGSGVETVLN